MKVLLVAFSYPPVNNAQAIRWHYLVKYLNNMGCSISVLAPDICKLRKEVIPCKTSRLVSRILQARANTNFSDANKSFMIKSIVSLLELFSFGDICLRWAFDLKRCLRNFTLTKFDIVIFSVEPHLATALPVLWVDHPRIILDIGDPPVSGIFSNLDIFNPLYRRILCSVFNKAYAIVYTGFNQRNCLEKKFPVLRDKKNTVIYQGYPEHKPITVSKVLSSEKKMKLFYAGNFIKRLREPCLLVDVLSEFKEEILFIHAGNTKWKEYMEESLGNSYLYLGKLLHNQVIPFYESADVLLYLGNNTCCQLSGKYFEYIGFRKPILHIYQEFCDDTISLFSAMPRGMSIYYDKLALKTAIIRLLDLFHNGKLNSFVRRSPSDTVEMFSWRALAKKYLDFLGGVV